MVRTSVALVFRLTESAVRNFNRIDAAITRMEKAAESGTQATRKFNAALTATGAAATVGLVLAAKNAASLEDALARLATVTRSNSQTMETSLKNAEDAARSFASQYSASAVESIKAQFELATAGVAVEEQIVGVQQAFLLAKATMGEFTQATQLLGQLLNTFGKDVNFGYLDPMTKVQRLTDILSSTVQRFQATLPVLQQGLKFIVGPAQQLSLRFEEVAVALGILNTAGFRGTLAGTALSNMFNKLSRAVDKLNLDPSKFQDLEGNLTSLAAFMREVNKALSDLSPLEGQIKLIEVFDIRAGRVIKTLADNADQLEKMANELQLASGATKEMADRIETTTSTSLRQFLNAIQNISTSIGKAINDVFRPFIRWLADLTQRIAGLVNAFPNLSAAIAIVATGIALTSAAIFAYNSIIVPAIAFTWAWVASFGGLIASFAVVIARIVTTLIHFALLIGAEIAAIAATLGLTGAIGALIAIIIELAIISVIGIIIIVIVKAIVALVKWLWSLVGASDAVADAVDKNSKGMRALNQNFTDTASKTRTLAAEMDRLGKAIQFGTRVSGSLESSLGITDLAKRIREIQRLSGGRIKLVDAAKQALSEVGQAGLARQFGEILFGPELAEEAGKGFERSLEQFRKFDDRDIPLNTLRIFNKLLKESATANEIATRSLVGDTQEVVDIYQRLSRIRIKIQGLDEAGDKAATLAKTQKEFAEAFVKSLNTLQNLPGFEALAESAFDFGLTAEASGKKFDKFMKNFLTAGSDANKVWVQLQNIIESTDEKVKTANVPIKELISTWERYKESTNKVRTGTVRLESALEKLEKGITPTGKAIKDVNERLDFLRLQQKRLGAQSLVLAAQLEVARKSLNQLGGTTPEQLEKILKQLTFKEEQDLKLRAVIDEGLLKRDIFSIFSRLTGGIGIGSALGEEIQASASALESSLGEVITGAISGPTAQVKIQNAIREMFTGAGTRQAAIQLGKILKSGITKGLDVAINNALTAIQPQVEALARAGDFSGVAELQSRAIDETTMKMTGLSSATVDTTTKMTDLEKQINKISVAAITATDGQAAALFELQQILSRGVDDPQGQARLTNFLKFLNQTGLSGSVAFKEGASALTRSFNEASEAAKNQQGTINSIQSAARAETDNFGNTVKSAMLAIGQTASQMATTLSPVFDLFAKAAGALTASFGAGAAAQNKLIATFDIRAAETTFNININGVNSSDISNFLEEDQIQEIVDETKKLLQEEMDEKLRALEERLKGK